MVVVILSCAELFCLLAHPPVCSCCSGFKRSAAMALGAPSALASNALLLGSLPRSLALTRDASPSTHKKLRWKQPTALLQGSTAALYDAAASAPESPSPSTAPEPPPTPSPAAAAAAAAAAEDFAQRAQTKTEMHTIMSAFGWQRSTVCAPSKDMALSSFHGCSGIVFEHNDGTDCDGALPSSRMSACVCIPLL